MKRIYTKRKYEKWTDAEVELLRKGKKPAGRSYIACYGKAKSLGLEPLRTRANGWTEAEVEKLRNGKAPAGRTPAACYQKATKLGIQFTTTGRNPPTEHDIDEIRNNRVPNGWKVSRARAVAYSIGMPSFRPMLTAKRGSIMKRYASMDALHRTGNSLSEIARLYGLSKERVRQCIKRWNAEAK